MGNLRDEWEDQRDAESGFYAPFDLNHDYWQARAKAAENAYREAKQAEAHAWTERAKMREAKEAAEKERDEAEQRLIEFIDWAREVHYMSINDVLCDPINHCSLCKPIWDKFNMLIADIAPEQKKFPLRRPL